MTTWKPDEGQLAWTRNFTASLSDGGCWGAPAMGIFRHDKAGKRLVLTERSPLYDEEMYERTVVAFGMVGYAVVDETPPWNPGIQFLVKRKVKP